MASEIFETFGDFEGVELIYNPAVSENTLFLVEDEDADYIEMVDEVFGDDDVTPFETERTITAIVEVACYVEVAEDASWFDPGDDGRCEPNEVYLCVSKGSDDGFVLSQSAKDFYQDQAVKRVEGELDKMGKLRGCRVPSGPPSSEMPRGSKYIGRGRYKM